MSIFLKILITIYFFIQLLNVINFSDPQINSYTILDFRADMDSPMKLPDYNMKLFFGFSDLNGNPAPLDPKIGRLEVWSSKGYYDGFAGFVVEATPIPMREVDFINERDTGLSYFDGSPVRGMYKAQDES